MSEKISIFESAHKGDYEVVTKKVEEDQKLITKTDEVSFANMVQSIYNIKFTF